MSAAQLSDIIQHFEVTIITVASYDVCSMCKPIVSVATQRLSPLLPKVSLNLYILFGKG